MMKPVDGCKTLRPSNRIVIPSVARNLQFSKPQMQIPHAKKQRSE